MSEGTQNAIDNLVVLCVCFAVGIGIVTKSLGWALIVFPVVMLASLGLLVDKKKAEERKP